MKTNCLRVSGRAALVAASITMAVPVARAAEPVAAAPGPISTSAREAVARAGAAGAARPQQDPASPAAPTKEGGFFSGPRGAIAIGLLVIGAGWVVYSTFNDRLENPARK